MTKCKIYGMSYYTGPSPRETGPEKIRAALRAGLEAWNVRCRENGISKPLSCRVGKVTFGPEWGTHGQEVAFCTLAADVPHLSHIWSDIGDAVAKIHEPRTTGASTLRLSFGVIPPPQS